MQQPAEDDVPVIVPVEGDQIIVLGLVEAAVVDAPIFWQHGRCNTDAVILAAITAFIVPAGLTR